MAIPDDPYFAGQILAKSGKPPGPGGPPPVAAWIGAYAVNLILPVYLGWMMTRGGGRVGMMVGIITVFALGWRACFVYREAVLTVSYGGWIVAASQFVPFLQMLAGLIGAGVAMAMTRETRDLSTAISGFLATLLTGGILIAFAAVFGLVIRWMISWYTRRASRGAHACKGEIQVL
jgi:hypothetical protein